MRHVAGYSLWIGNAGDLWDPRGLLSAEIQAVIEVADNEQIAVLPRELTRGRFPLSDGGDNPKWLLKLAAETVAALIRAKVPVLVCCSAGLSRSLCVGAGGLALLKQRPFAEALMQVIGDGPADVSPAMFLHMQEALCQK